MDLTNWCKYILGFNHTTEKQVMDRRQIGGHTYFSDVYADLYARAGQ
jgi:hypothetical protein